MILKVEKITIDGVNIEDMNRDDLRKNVRYGFTR